MRLFPVSLAICLLAVGCVDMAALYESEDSSRNYSAELREYEEYKQNMAKLFAEYFSAGELKTLRSVLDDKNLVLQLLSVGNDDRANVDPVQIDRRLQEKWGKDLCGRIDAGAFHDRSCQLKRTLLNSSDLYAERKKRTNLDSPMEHRLFVAQDLITTTK